MGVFTLVIHLAFIVFIITFVLGAFFNMRRSVGSSRVEGAKFIAALMVLVPLYYSFITYKSAKEEAIRTEHAPANRPGPELSTAGASAGTSERYESGTATLKNYRVKGDAIKIECSGPTGSIVCKPAK